MYQQARSGFWSAFSDRRFFSANIVALSGVVLLVAFPRNGAGEAILLSFFSTLVLPIVFVRAILHEPLSNFGFSWGSRSWAFNAGLVFCALLVFAAFLWSMLLWYPGERPVAVPGNVRANFGEFIWYMAQSMTLNGFLCLFFQGFVLFSWKNRFRMWSVAWVTALFCAFLFAKNGFSPHAAFLFFVPWSVLASLTAYFSESVFVAFSFLFFSDILAIVSVMLQV